MYMSVFTLQWFPFNCVRFDSKSDWNKLKFVFIKWINLVNQVDVVCHHGPFNKIVSTNTKNQPNYRDSSNIIAIESKCFIKLQKVHFCNVFDLIFRCIDNICTIWSSFNCRIRVWLYCLQYSAIGSGFCFNKYLENEKHQQIDPKIWKFHWNEYEIKRIYLFLNIHLFWIFFSIRNRNG